MLRSLFAGVSGLVNHQTKLDVIGNNIANINTIGYKSGRVSFQELLNQTVRGGSRAGDGIGGTNPIQIGLGMSVASVSTHHSQGNLQATGNMFDFALQGDGFFVISMGNNEFFTRAGDFGLDGVGHLVHQSSGGILQGYVPDENGVIRDSSTLQSIIIDKSQYVPAQATSYIGLGGNLKADSEALGTVTDSGKFLKLAEAATTLASISQQDQGIDLDVRVGDVITISGSIGTDAIVPYPSNLVVNETTNLQDILNFIEESISDASGGTYPPGSVNITDGQITVDGHPTEDIHGLRLIIGGNPDFNTAFTFPSTIDAGPTSSGAMIQTLLTVAEETDLLVDLYNQDGEALDGPSSIYGILGMTLSLQAYVGGEANTPGTFEIEATSTIENLLDRIEAIIGITNVGNAGVVLNADGEIRVEGNVGLDNEIDSISITDASGNVTLGNTFIFTEVQGAKDSEIHPVSIDIFDSLGTKHHLTITFRKHETSTDVIEWFWQAEVEGIDPIQSGDRGRLVFSNSGELVSFTFEDGSGSIRFDPVNGAEMIDLSIQTALGTSLLTQTAGPSTAKVVASDGYTSGTLESTFVDETGTVMGQFSNGINNVLAQVAVASFANSGGLLRGGNNLYSENSNSGRPIIGTIRGSAFNRITPGSLEMSNVDLAQEFTQMITAQRGFQANARIITTGDEMLTELVNLKR